MYGSEMSSEVFDPKFPPSFHLSLVENSEFQWFELKSSSKLPWFPDWNKHAGTFHKHWATVLAKQKAQICQT